MEKISVLLPVKDYFRKMDFINFHWINTCLTEPIYPF